MCQHKHSGPRGRASAPGQVCRRPSCRSGSLCRQNRYQTRVLSLCLLKRAMPSLLGKGQGLNHKARFAQIQQGTGHADMCFIIIPVCAPRLGHSHRQVTWGASLVLFLPTPLLLSPSHSILPQPPNTLSSHGTQGVPQPQPAQKQQQARQQAQPASEIKVQINLVQGPSHS
jgi:hypothetical protein